MRARASSVRSRTIRRLRGRFTRFHRVPGIAKELRRRRFARVVTEGLSPMVVVPLVLLAVALASGPDLAGGLRWGLTSSLLVVGAPLVYLRRQLRSGRIADHNVTVREQRKGILLVGSACLMLTFAVVMASETSRELRALVCTQLIGLVLFGGFTLIRCKVSFHAGISTGSVFLLAQVLGWALLALLPLAALVAWSRIALGDHTLREVTGGAALGGFTTSVVFPLMLTLV